MFYGALAGGGWQKVTSFWDCWLRIILRRGRIWSVDEQQLLGNLVFIKRAGEEQLGAKLVCKRVGGTAEGIFKEHSGKFAVLQHLSHKVCN